MGHMIISVVVEKYYHFTNSGHMIILKIIHVQGGGEKIPRKWSISNDILVKKVYHFAIYGWWYTI